MFTNKFKVTLASLLAVVAFGGLGLNQAKLNKDVTDLKTLKPTVVVVTPTLEPTATPSATPVLKYLPLKKPTSAVK